MVFAWLAACDIAVVLILAAFTPGPLQEPYQFADNLVGMPADQVVRPRRAATLFMLFVFPVVLDRSIWGRGSWAGSLESGVVVAAFDVGVPLAVGIAVLKYRLYDIDIIINRTLVYGSLSATLALVYFGGVVSLQYIFRAFTGGESNLAVVASTLAIAALFVPLRRRIQCLIDQCFYRRKYDAAKTLEAFSARLRSETDLDTLCEDLVSVVRKTLQPEHISMWLRSPEEK